ELGTIPRRGRQKPRFLPAVHGVMSAEIAAGDFSPLSIQRMKFTGKVVGGAIGLLAGGPIGAAVGVLLGHQFDEYSADADDPRLRHDADAAAIGEQFFRTTFRTMGHVAKSDGRVSESEIAAARAVMSDLRLAPPQVRAAIDCFTAGKQPDFN